MKKKVGLLTFHAAYNYGSVLQAYATKEGIEKLGAECKTINFRFAGQEKMYALYSFHGNLRSILSNFYVMPKHFLRVQRSQRFEAFIKAFLNPTKVVRSRNEILNELPHFDTYLSGGDQLWNIHVGEYNMDLSVAGVFYLDFVKEARKASFSTSIGNTKFDELHEKKQLLKDYDYISTRESIAAEMLREVVDCSIPVDEVLDPVFLLDTDDWKKLVNQERIIKDKYVLVYTLATRRFIESWSAAVKPFADKHNLKVVFVSPKFSSSSKDIITVLNAGPLEFLNLYANAEVVIADTFHALCFSILFRKPFYVLGNKYYKDDIRKTALVKKLMLEDRMIGDESDLKKIDDYSINYTLANSVLEKERMHSIECLKKAIGDT